MFDQLLTPVGGSLVWSFFVAALPIATVLGVAGFGVPVAITWRQSRFAILTVALIVASWAR